MKKLTALILFLTINAQAQTTIKQDKNSKDWKTLNHSDYSIQYPSTWELNQTGQMGMSFAILSPKESEDDKFKENINLLIQDLTGKNIDLNKYTEISENQIKTLATNSRLIESKRIKAKTGEYQKMIYSADQGKLKLEFEQYYWVIDQKAYVLTFTTELDKFIVFREIGEKIMNSFVLKK